MQSNKLFYFPHKKNVKVKLKPHGSVHYHHPRFSTKSPDWQGIGIFEPVQHCCKG
jgi:hypothetical protein